MRVLIIDSATSDVVRAKAALVTGGHTVEMLEPRDSKNLRDALERPWDVIVLEWLSQPTTIEIIERVSAAEGDVPACIVCSDKATPANIEAAFRAGAEDFIRKPYVIEQLRGRLGRIAAQREYIVAARAQGLTESAAATSCVTALAAWAEFQSLSAEAVGGLTMVGLSVSASPKRTPPSMGASMTLALPSHRLLCEAVVDGDDDSLRFFAEAAVGTRTEEAIADLLKEVANTAGGAFMRAALEEQLVLTCGLPAIVPRTRLDGVLDAASQTLLFWLVEPTSGAQLRVRLGVRAQRNVFVRVGSLREGMVLASDLRGVEGIVLLTAGTRFTSSSSERVRRMLDGRRMVEVADVAA